MVRHRFFIINHFERQTLSNTPGIDGHLNGTPVSLKEYTDNSVSGVLKHVSKSETQIANAGLSNVDIYANAKNISKDALIDFASNGPLVDIPNQGFIKNIYVQTADGWILIN